MVASLMFSDNLPCRGNEIKIRNKGALSWRFYCILIKATQVLLIELFSLT